MKLNPSFLSAFSVRHGICALSVLSLGLGGLAPALPSSAAPAPFKLRLRLRAGDQFVYQLSFSGNVTLNAQGKPPVPIHFSGTVQNRRTILVASSNGLYKQQDEVLGGQMTYTMKGRVQTMPVTPSAPQVSTVNNLGKVVLSKTAKSQVQSAGFGVAANSRQVMEQVASMSAFPLEPLQVGSAWQRKIGFDFFHLWTMKIQLDSKVARMASLSGVPTAEIDTSLSLPAKFSGGDNYGSGRVNGLINGVFRTNYSTATGMPIHTDGDLKGTLGVQMIGAFSTPTGIFDTNKAGVHNVGFRFDLKMKMNMLAAQRGAPTAVASIRELDVTPPVSTKAQIRKRPAGGTPAVVLPATPASPVVETPATPLPTVDLILPTNKGVVKGEVPVQARLSGIEEEVGYVAFLANGERLYETNTQPYRFIWDTTELPAGLYKLSVEVYGKDGTLLRRSPLRRVRVRPVSQAKPDGSGSGPAGGIPT